VVTAFKRRSSQAANRLKLVEFEIDFQGFIAKGGARAKEVGFASSQLELIKTDIKLISRIDTGVSHRSDTRRELSKGHPACPGYSGSLRSQPPRDCATGLGHRILSRPDNVANACYEGEDGPAPCQISI